MKSIAVIGAGTSGYLAVLFLCRKIIKSKKLRGYTVEWIFPGTGKTIGVGEATTNHVQDFLDDLGIDKREVITALKGNLKLGLKFVNFNRPGGEFIHPFGDDEISAPKLEYMIRHNLVTDDVLSYDSIATHFDVSMLRSYLDGIFPQFDNLKITNDTVTDVKDLGHDIVVDCTGFNRHIMSQVTDDRVKTITDKIPNNRATIFRSPYTVPDQQRLAYTTCTGMDYGWCWNIPLREEISFGYVHDGSYNVTNEFIEHLQETIHRPVSPTDLQTLEMKTGRGEEHIVRRGSQVFVSIGLSSCFIEPLESTGLHFVVDGIRYLGKYLQKKITIDEFNTRMNTSFDSVIDFVVAHYKFSENTNEYWSKYKSIDIQHHKPNNIFPPLSWNYVLKGMNEPTRVDLPGLSIPDMVQIKKGTTYNKWIENESFAR